jgi:hypothetical protein
MLIELANGTILYGEPLVKSAAGITIRTPDGKTSKLERKQLSPRTILDLNLPPENSPGTANQTSPKKDTPLPKETPQQTEELERAIADLRAENAALRAQAKPVTYRVVGLPKSTPFLNVRKGPGSEFPVIGTLAPDAKGITLGPKRVTNGWTVWQEITGGGYTGWVNAQYLLPEPSTP